MVLHNKQLNHPKVPFPNVLSVCSYISEDSKGCSYASTRTLEVGGKEYSLCEFHFNLMLLQMAVSKLNYLPAVNTAGN